MTTSILLIIGVALILLNARAIKKEKESFHFNLEQAEDDMKDFSVEMGKLKMEFAESLIEIQQDIEELKEKTHQLSSQIDKRHPKEERIAHGREKEPEENHIQSDENIEQRGKVEEKKDDNTISELKIVTSEEQDKEDKVEDEEVLIPEIKEENPRNRLAAEIQEGLNAGLSIEQIADQLRIGKGEVLLIKDLYLK